MIRHTILFVLATLAGHQLCSAGTVTEVTYSGASGERNVVQSDGVTAVPDGNYVEIGYFDGTLNLSANSGNLSALGAAWHEYGFTNIATFAPFGPPVPGRFAGDSISSDSSFDNKQIYLWIFQTTGNGAPASDFSNVNQYGIFTSTLSTWTFPVNGSINNLTSISSSDVNTFVFGGSVSGTPGSLELANVVLVPEPGVLSLLAVGLVTGRFLFRRRR